MAKPRAQVSILKKKTRPVGSGCATFILTSFLFTFLLKSPLSFFLLFYWNLYFLFTFLLKSLLSLYFSIEISTFSLLFYWNLYFLFTFCCNFDFRFTMLLKFHFSLYVSIEISTFSLLFLWNFYFSLLFYWNPYFLFTFQLKSPLSLYFSIEISTFSLLFYWNLYFLFTFLLKSLLSLYFSIEISSFSYLLVTLPLDCLHHACFFFMLAHCPTPSTQTATSWLSTPHDRAIQLWASSWLLYHLTELFKCELPLDYPTTWLSYSIVS